LTTVGDILIVVLGRFLNDGKGQAPQKNTVPVRIEEYEKFDVYTEGDEYVQRYKPLIGGVFHTGDLAGGHNVACVKDLSLERWYLFDDDRVEPIEFHEVAWKMEEAYILVYGKDVDHAQIQKHRKVKNKPKVTQTTYIWSSRRERKQR
jgi:ubiquitin C-terminal hydrolase